MRKVLYLVIGILLLAVGATLPYFMGFLAQRKCLELSPMLSNLAYADIIITDYKRHWFSSDATFVVKLKHPLLTGENAAKVDANLQSWKVMARILHGPVVFLPHTIKLAQAGVVAEVVLTKEQSVLLRAEPTALPIVNIVLGINLDGSSSLHIKGSAFSYQSSNLIFSSQGADVDMYFSAFLNKMRSRVYLTELKFAQTDLVLQLEGLKVNYVGTKNDLDLWLGQRQVALKSLLMKDNRDAELILQNLIFNNQATEEHHAVAMQGELTIDSASVDRVMYTKNALVWEAHDLDAVALVKLQHEIRSLSEARKISIQQGIDVFHNCSLLLQKGMVFTIRQFNITSPWGALVAAGQVIVPRAKNQGIMLWPDLRSEIGLRIDQPLAQHLLTEYYQHNSDAAVKPDEQAKNTINNWLQMGVLLINGNAYQTKLTYDKEWLINDKPIPAAQK